MNEQKKNEIRRRMKAKFKDKPLPKAPTKALPPINNHNHTSNNNNKEITTTTKTIASDDCSDTDSERSKFNTLSSKIPSGSQEMDDIDDVVFNGYRKETFRIHSSNEQAVEEYADEQCVDDEFEYVKNEQEEQEREEEEEEEDENALKDMKKRIISHRHIHTKSLFMASTPPPPTRRLPSIHKKTATSIIYDSKSSNNTPTTSTIISPPLSSSQQSNDSPFALIKQSIAEMTPDVDEQSDELMIQFEHIPNLQTEFQKNRSLFQSQPNIAYTQKQTIRKKERMSDVVFTNKSNKGIHSMHPSNRKNKQKIASMNKLKERMAQKMKNEQQKQAKKNENLKKERSESLDIRQIRKRKIKRKVRQNIFETANALQTNQILPKQQTNANIHHKASQSAMIGSNQTSKKRMSEFFLAENEFKESEESDSSSSSSSESSSSESSSNRSMFNPAFKVLGKGAISPRLGSISARNSIASKQEKNNLNLSPTPTLTEDENEEKKESVRFVFGHDEISQHQNTIYEKTNQRRTKTPQFMPSEVKKQNRGRRRLQTARFGKERKEKKMNKKNHSITDLTYGQLKELRKMEEAKNSLSSITWIRGDVIGKGAFGTVYKGWDKMTKRLIAIKEFKYLFRDKKKTLDEFDKETQIMKSLRHKNIVQFYQYKMDEKERKIWLLMEYVPGNSIESIYVKQGVFAEVMIQKYVYQIVNGLDYAHSQGIIHRDVKGKNILIDNKGIVKIADFGSAILSKIDDQNNVTANFESTPLWTAPEVLIEGKFDSKIDVWSTGCVIIEMATAKRPWHECKFETAFQALAHIGNTDKSPQWPQSLSVECQSFIKLCLLRDPKKRKSMKYLLQHRFLKTKNKVVDENMW